MFNDKKFSEILTKIKEYYGSISDFANAADVGRSYLSKYINNRLPSPPTPKILEKIAEASNGITNYDELMQVCGYLNTSSKEIAIQNIFKEFENKIDLLNIPNLDKDFIFNQLSLQDEKDNTVLNKISKYIETNYGTNEKSKKLFDILSIIDRKIKDIIQVSNNIGIPLYSISKVPMYKINYFPFEYSNDYIAVKATNDKMLPLLGINDIAIVHLENELIDGQTVLLLIDNSYYDIAKIFSESNTCKLYYMNSKYEEINIERIQIIGEIISVLNKSAFKNSKGGN